MLSSFYRIHLEVHCINCVPEHATLTATLVAGIESSSVQVLGHVRYDMRCANV